MGANPVDRGKPGSKIHLVCEAGGLPLTAVVTAANVADVTMLAAMVDDIPPVRTPSGRRVPVQASWTPTWVTTVPATVPGCGAAGSPCGSLGGGSSRRAGWAASLAGGAGAVVAELLPAAGHPLGSGLGAVVRVRAVGMYVGLFQPTLTEPKVWCDS